MLFNLPVHLREIIIRKEFKSLGLSYLFRTVQYDPAIYKLYCSFVLSKPIDLIVQIGQVDILESILPDEADLGESIILPDENTIDLITNHKVSLWGLGYFPTLKDNILMMCFIYDQPALLQILLKTYPSIDFSNYIIVAMTYICYYNSNHILDHLIELDLESIIKLICDQDHFKYYSHCCISKHSGNVWASLCQIYQKHKLFSRVRYQRQFLVGQIIGDINDLYLNLPLDQTGKTLLLKQDDLIMESLMNLEISVEKILINKKGIYLIIRLVALNHNWDLIERLIQQYREKSGSELITRDILLGLLAGFTTGFDPTSKVQSIRISQNYLKKAWKSYWLKFNAPAYMIPENDPPEEKDLVRISREYTSILYKTIDNLI